jgi:DNA topoisomerase VI subunit B
MNNRNYLGFLKEKQQLFNRIGIKCKSLDEQVYKLEQNEKDLSILVEDLSERVPFRPLVKCGVVGYPFILVGIDVTHENVAVQLINTFNHIKFETTIDKVRLYLRSLENMTEEEKLEEERLHDPRICISELITFYKKNNLDYRGLIPRGLAIEQIPENHE